ncbi:MAG: tetratricopeptide repeat protein [Tepidisphaeraceae bacterium]
MAEPNDFSIAKFSSLVAQRRVLLRSFCFMGALALPQSANAYDSEQFQSAIESLSPATVAEWEQKAKSGNVLAQNVLGMAYKYGRGTEQNHARSLQWFRAAADQGDADAQFNLGRIYGKAFGTYAKLRAAPHDEVQAVYWYCKSAEQGYLPAQSSLAEIYAEGSQGIARDYVKAYYWMSLAGAAGDAAASRKLESYATHLTASEIIDAQALVANWNGRQASARARGAKSFPQHSR